MIVSEILFNEENEKSHSLSLLWCPCICIALLQHGYLQQAVCSPPTWANLAALCCSFLLYPSQLFLPTNLLCTSNPILVSYSQRAWTDPGGARSDLRKLGDGHDHYLADNEDLILSGTWDGNSPWQKLVAQLLKIHHGNLRTCLDGEGCPY